jgi:aminotransferase
MDNKENYRICTRCVMDTTAKEITFDGEGICNFCKEFEVLAHKTIWRPLDVRLKELDAAVKKIKELGKNDKYD